MIPSETIQTIIETARIEEVVSEFVNLRKRGVNYLGLCPFHNEKTPSFTVSPSKGIFKCFGCGKAGNAVSFLMEHEHISYAEALRYLAKKYHIEIQEEVTDISEIAARNERESMLLLNGFAQKHFSEILFNTEEGKAIGLTYLKERGFTTDIIKKFQLGYSPDQFDNFFQAALKNGFKKEFVIKTGLGIEKDGVVYDRFRGRIMFPIHNLSGKIIGFTGRILTSDKTKAKYVNSPESEIFSKSKSLYGIFFARNAIVQKDNCYLVEGNADVISLFQAGIENVVASSGTSLTTDQVRLIKRYTNNITILYDGDAAGIKAAVRGTEMILEEGMNVRIVMFPEGEDPDSFARKHHQNEVQEYILKNTMNFITFKLRLMLEESRNDPLKLAGLIKDIVQTISLIPDPIVRSLYIKECSGIMNVPEQTLMNELNRILRKKLAKKEPEVREEDLPEETITGAVQPALYDPFDSFHQEQNLVELLLNYGNAEIYVEEKDTDGKTRKKPVKVARFIIDDLTYDNLEFKDPLFAAMFDTFTRLIKEGKIPEEDYFINHEKKDIAERAIHSITSPYELSPNWRRKKIIVPTRDDEDKKILTKDVSTSVLVLKSRRLEKMIHENQQKLLEISPDDTELVNAFLAKHKMLDEIYCEINRRLGRIITR